MAENQQDSKPVDLQAAAKKAATDVVQQEQTQPEPWTIPGWYHSRAFIGSILTTGLCLATVAAAGHLSIDTGIACASPLLAWAGINLPSVLLKPPTK